MNTRSDPNVHWLVEICVCLDKSFESNTWYQDLSGKWLSELDVFWSYPERLQLIASLSCFPAIVKILWGAKKKRYIFGKNELHGTQNLTLRLSEQRQKTEHLRSGISKGELKPGQDNGCWAPAQQWIFPTKPHIETACPSQHPGA